MASEVFIHAELFNTYIDYLLGQWLKEYSNYIDRYPVINLIKV